MNSSKTQNPQFRNLSKPLHSNDDVILATTFYEPTSVLDPHLSSSPASAAAGSDNVAVPGLPPDYTWDPPASYDWDPLCWLLEGGDEKDDPAFNLKSFPDYSFLTHDPDASNNPPLHSLSPLPDSFNRHCQPSHPPIHFDTLFSNPTPPLLSAPATDPAFEQVHLDQLIRAAQAVESDDFKLANVILARLNHQLAAPIGRPIQRAACYFREALQSLLSFPERPINETLRSPVEIVRRISAYKALSDLSPVPQFASFTANQTVLEALEGSRAVHLIDFEIGLGGQWSSFMHEIAARCRAAGVPPPSVRITAIVPEESLETDLTGENLRDFASGLGLRFSIQFVRVGSQGSLVLRAIRLEAGESVAVSFTPAVFHLLGAAPESVAGFLSFVRGVSPRVAVFVDAECGSGSGSAHSGTRTQSFRRSFVTGLEYYTVILESLDAAATAVGIGHDQVKRIERSLIRPKVCASLGSWGNCALPWKEMLEGVGMKPVPFSEFTESQAEWLTRRAPIGGFYVARREGSMVLSWQGQELAATSAWKS